MIRSSPSSLLIYVCRPTFIEGYYVITYQGEPEEGQGTTGKQAQQDWLCPSGCPIYNPGGTENSTDGKFYFLHCIFGTHDFATSP